MSEEIKFENEAQNDPNKGGHTRRPHHGKHGRYYNNRRPRNQKFEAENEEFIEAVEEEFVDETVDLPVDTLAEESDEGVSEAIIDENEEVTEEPAPITENEPSQEEPITYTEVIGVRFRTSGKIYYFDPQGLCYPLAVMPLWTPPAAPNTVRLP